MSRTSDRVCMLELNTDMTRIVCSKCGWEVPATHGGTCQCGRSGFLNLSFFPGRAATLLYRSRLP